MRLAGNTDQWTVLAFPGDDLSPTFASYGPEYVLVKSFPERQLAAWLFLKWLAAPEQHTRLVQADASFPLRASELIYLQGYRNSHPQWAAAVEVLPSAQAEPALSSWGIVRWTLKEAATQLFRSYFTLDQLPGLTSFLDWTANDIHQNFSQSPSPAATGPAPVLEPGAATSTPTARPTPTRTASPVPTTTPLPSSSN